MIQLKKTAAATKQDETIELLQQKICRLENELDEARNRIALMQLRDEEARKMELFFTLCAQCRKVKDKDGKWLELEAYLFDNVTHGITHGICPECVRALYPDYAR